MGKKKQLMVESGGVLHRPALAEDQKGGKWSATVWKLDQVNLNGRIYGLDLAKRIVAENPVTVAYDGHDVDWRTGQEYGITKAVCSNPRIEDGELRVDIDFVDEPYEKLLRALVDKGVAIGVSSVGWGETDEKGRVKADTYELVRFLDFVTCPAGEVYATIDENRAGGRRRKDTEESVDKPVADGAMARRRAEVARSMARLVIGER